MNKAREQRHIHAMKRIPEARENLTMTYTQTRLNDPRQRGVAAILSMMFLVIFGSLAAAMAIVAQGNLITADSHLKINRSLAASETGMRFLMYRLNLVTANVQTLDGLIDSTNAPALWTQVRGDLLTSLTDEFHTINNNQPREVGTTLIVGPISLGAGQPTFTASFTPHPITAAIVDPNAQHGMVQVEDYDSAYYQRPPYSNLATPVSSAAPLDETWIRVRVEARDGAANRPVIRTLQMDFKMDKKIKFAVLSKSRVMIGRNVMIDGPIGSRFTETNLANGHPIQMESDFRGLDSTLDANLDLLVNTLALNDTDGDNRLLIANPAEVVGIANPAALDNNNDGYIDDYDFFVGQYDANADGDISAIELDTANNINAAQLLELIDTFGDPARPGYNDGTINNDDRYAKIRGDIKIKAAIQDWQNGAANGQYQDYLQGSIHPDNGEVPLMFSVPDADMQDIGPQNFNMSAFSALATGNLQTQSDLQAVNYDPNDPTSPFKDTSGTQIEEVPFGAAHPYDYYGRPVYENMTFTNVTIPKGENALFKNCKFIGATFIETSVQNTDPDFNYVGIMEADGTPKYPTLTANVGGVTVTDTKTESNNVRFHNCTFEGAVASDAPPAFTHIRNKIAFTGQTKFDIDNSPNLTTSQKKLYKRSTILTPHYSVEMGTFNDPTSTTETVNLSGTIVTGILDIRGQAKINGTLLTTFEPVSNQAPVVGSTSPQFNTTLGYFPSTAGDLEAELPATGVGVIQVTYDPTIALPDGILASIEVAPVTATYFEGTGY